MSGLPTGTVTFLFTDIEGSTRLWEQHGEAMRAALTRHDAIMREVIGARGGVVFKTMGDAFCVAFGRAHEGVAAALEVQQRMRAESWGSLGAIRVRMALHTGEADERDGDYFGAPLNYVARMQAIGHGEMVLISSTTGEITRAALPAEALLRDMGQHKLKDIEQPQRVYLLTHPSLPSEFPALKSVQNLPNNLPRQLTSFIGRESELAEVKRLLGGPVGAGGGGSDAGGAAHGGLLTLSGTGGGGKTRLAIQAAGEMLESFPEGVWLVELAALTDPALVVQTCASTLGLREEPGRPLVQTLAAFLKPKAVLIVLDNCEHLLQACSEMAQALLSGCPRLTIMATSREGLGIAGERTFRVPSLSTPDPRTPMPVERLVQFDSVRLLVERARAVAPAFQVTAQNAVAVAKICHRLDGIPLAVELVAARLKAMSAEQVADRLNETFRLLTGGSRTALPRQQTLRALIDWSYGLLDESQRLLLNRLSVFAGGWSLDAAETICSGEAIDEFEVIDFLTHLVDKSLVVFDERPDIGARYRMLETIKQYGRDKLRETGGGEDTRAKHQEFFAKFAEKEELGIRGKEQAKAVQAIEREHDNIRAALEWCEAGGGSKEAALRTVTALWRFWWSRGYVTEGRSQIGAVVAATAGDPPSQKRAIALHAAGWLAKVQGDLDAAKALFEQACDLWRAIDDKRGLAGTLATLGLVAQTKGDLVEASKIFEESLATQRALNSTRGIAMSLLNMGALEWSRGEFDGARVRWEESLAIYRQLDDKLYIAGILNNLGNLALKQSDIPRANAVYVEALGLFRDVGGAHDVALVLEGLAAVAAAEQKFERAARLYGAAEAFRQSTGVPMPSEDKPDHDRSIAATRAGLEASATGLFERSWALGRGWDVGEAVKFAMGI